MTFGKLGGMVPVMLMPGMPKTGISHAALAVVVAAFQSIAAFVMGNDQLAWLTRLPHFSVKAIVLAVPSAEEIMSSDVFEPEYVAPVAKGTGSVSTSIPSPRY